MIIIIMSSKRNIIHFSGSVANLLLNVNELLSELREYVQKMENNMEICRMCCKRMENPLKFSNPSNY